MSFKSLGLRAAAGILLACLLLTGCAGCRRTESASGVPRAPEKTEAPAPAAEPSAEPTAPERPRASDGDAPAENGTRYAAGFVRVVSPTASGWLPLPEEEAYVFPLRQINSLGQETLNVIRVTPTGVCMESASCENQNCVHQGEVTLENRKDRALMNMIICLPNQVYLELYSAEELMSVQDGQEETPP